jgi:hypothetical protein
MFRVRTAADRIWQNASCSVYRVPSHRLFIGRVKLGHQSDDNWVMDVTRIQRGPPILGIVFFWLRRRRE